MAQHRMDKLKDILRQACRLDSVSRKAFFEESFTNDDALAETVSRFLDKNSRDTILEDQKLLEMLAELISTTGSHEGDVQHIGPYQILGTLGEGGMGRVYLAYQRKPIKRKVALKLIKTSISSKPTLARFKREAQALARLEHPNIASVFDSGLTSEKIPYFTMEYVPGQTIDRYCREQELGISERITLLIQVCEAIQHAHYKGIVHRDLKPSNILVRREGNNHFVKVIDFGIAKTISGEPLADESYQTHQGAILGTLAYLSPEQADTHSLEVDSRTDIYGLGAILYELLTGFPPHDENQLKAMPYDRAVASIRLDDPLPPSQKVSAVHQTKTDAHASAWSSHLKGELDWLVAKALDKQKERRYATAEAMAEDLRRYLRREPLQAAPVGRLYRLKKFSQRHRLGFISASMILLALTIGLGISLVSLQEAKSAKQESERALLEAREQEAKAKALFSLIKGFIEKPNPYLEKQDPNLKFKDVLLYIEDHVETELDGRADLKLEIYLLLGNIYYTLGNLKQAEHFLLKTESLKDLVTKYLNARSHAQIAEFYLLTNDFEKTERYIKACETTYAVENDPSISLKIARLRASYLRKTNRPRKALEAFNDILNKSQSVTEQSHQELYLVKAELAEVYIDLKELDKSIAIYQELHAEQSLRFGENHPKLLIIRSNLARAYLNNGQMEQAAVTFERIAQIRERALGEAHFQTLTAKHNAAWAYHELGMLSKALSQFEGLVPQFEQVYGPENDNTLWCKNSLANALLSLERYAEAANIFRNLYQVQRRKEGPDNPRTLMFQHNYGNALLKHGDFDAAEGVLKDALSRRLSRYGNKSLETIHTRQILGQNYLAQGELQQAAQAFASNVQDIKLWFPKETLRLATYQVYLGLSFIALGKEDDGYTHFNQGYPKLSLNPGPELDVVHNLMTKYDVTR